MSGEKQTRANRRRAGAIACGALLLALLGGAVPLAGQVTPPTAAVPGDWTWMSGSDTLGSSEQGVSGVYGAVGAFGSGYFPGGRWGAPSWIDSNNHLWLFGGFGFAGNGNFGGLNDLWQFNPSTNYWAYMGGGTTLANSYCDASPTYGTQGVFAAGNVPGGRQSAASWIDKSGNLWLFGGSGAAAGNANACGTYSIGYLNDLWEFNLSTASTSTPEWAWMGGSSAPNVSGVYVASSGTLAPGAREFAATWVDKSGNFWLFGGFGYDANGDFGYLNDLWEFNPNPGEATTNQWTWIDGSSTVPTYSGQPGNYGPLGSSGGAYVPGGRYGASTWTDSSGNFWLFGGLGIDANGNGGNLNDIWEFNPTPGEATTNYWAWMGGSNTEGGSAVYGTMGTPATTNTPGGSYEASSWVDNSGNFWIFGGSGGEPNSVWAFNPPTSQWVWMGGSNTANQPGSYSALLTPAATNIPGGRNQTTSWTDSYGNFWLFGGDGIACSSCGTGGGTEVGAFNDLWVYPPPPICWGPPSTLQISPATLPYVGFVGGSYFQNFTATGGCEAGYVWSITSGATTLTNLGLSFSSGGDLSGYTNAP
ncbi:MAG: kelch repeat-containing protein, partial [Terracidiphilus sp.]